MQKSYVTKISIRFKNWAYKWGMEFNPSKTESMIFSNKMAKSTPSFYFNGIKLTQVSTHKHLGLFFSDNLKWSKAY